MPIIVNEYVQTAQELTLKSIRETQHAVVEAVKTWAASVEGSIPEIPAHPFVDELPDESFVHGTRQHHAHDFHVGRGRHPTPTDEGRLRAEAALQRGDFIAAAVHDDQLVSASHHFGEQADERGISLRATSDLHDASHSGRPVVSGRPNETFAF